MADEDNFDIDIYGDGEGMDEDSKEFYKQENKKSIAMRGQQQADLSKTQQRGSTDNLHSAQIDGSSSNHAAVPNGKELIPKPQQGLKRKGDSDERHVDAGATNALMISDLHWWTTEDDVREWVNEAGAEDELKDITFSEHKVNGKSKGQVFLEFLSPQASTATKRQMEALSDGTNGARKFSVVFTNPSSNPFKTLPKDAPTRSKDDRSQRSSSASFSAPAHHSNYNSGNNNNFRGGRGGYGNRGGYNQNYNHNNRNFSGPGNAGTFGNGQGFQANMPMMNNFGNFGGRGGMMGGNNMRGGMNGMRGRGGMNNNMMPMGMIGMGMGMGMGMNPMMAGMGPQGFGISGPQFNPGMFNQNGNQGMSGGDWNHGAKRQRQD